MWSDVRHTVRSLAKHPAFLAAGVLVLALGNGLNTAVFSVVNAILFRSPPVRDPGQLRYLYRVSPLDRGPVPALSFRHLLDIRKNRDLLVDATLTSTVGGRIRTGMGIERARGERVAGSYFETLGVQPLIGRGFVWEVDEGINAERVVVISHDLWRTRFHSDPNVLGKTLELSSDTVFGAYATWHPHTIIGVMPRDFRGMVSPWDATQYWVPFLRHAADEVDQARQTRGPGAQVSRPDDFGGLGIVRLREDASPPSVAAWLNDFNERAWREVTPARRGWSFQLLDARVVRFPFDPRGEIVPGRLAASVMCIAGVVLLIAAANLGGMLMARGVSRRSELALRLTLGATRGRVIRQLMAESLLLSIAGGALGILMARWLLDLFAAATPSRFVHWQVSVIALDVPIDWRVVAFSAASCVTSGILVGLLPARGVLRQDLLSGLTGQSVSTTPATSTFLQRWIVAPQVCLSLVLLLLAGVLVRSVVRDEMRSPGYDANGIVLVDVDTRVEESGLTLDRNADSATRAARWSDRLARIKHLHETVERVPGIESATIVGRTPMTSVPLPWMSGWVTAREGFRPDGRHVWVSRMDVAPGYFATLRIPLLRGRDFDNRDRGDGLPVAVVSETLARAVWPGVEPIGQHFAAHEPNSALAPRWVEVIGVAGDVRPPLSSHDWHPTYYVPIEQSGLALPSTIVVRGEHTAGDLIRAVSTAVVDAEPDALALAGRSMGDGIGQLLYPRRVATAVLGLAGLIGLVLASSGLYGLISYSVAQRVREVGVRMALGADRFDILRLILREGATVSIFGMAFGFALGFVAIRVVSRLVTALPPLDLATLMVVPLFLGGAIFLACYLPALRAARVDPMDVLRGL
jgi:putative ABC transport system permease protein